MRKYIALLLGVVIGLGQLAVTASMAEAAESKRCGITANWIGDTTYPSSLYKEEFHWRFLSDKRIQFCIRIVERKSTVIKLSTDITTSKKQHVKATTTNKSLTAKITLKRGETATARYAVTYKNPARPGGRATVKSETYFWNWL